MIALLLAIGSGLLFALSLPPTNIEWLGWVALTPLFVAAYKRRPLEAVGLGLVAGVSCGLFQVRQWPDTEGSGMAYYAFVCLAALFGAMALAASQARMRMAGIRWVLFVATFGVALEWLTTFAPLPLNFALCQHQNIRVIQIASLTGIWGVSFLLWAFNAALADAALLRRPITPGLIAVAVLLILAWGYSIKALTSGPGHDTLRVAAIQDYDPGDIAGFSAPTGSEEVPDRGALTRRAAARGAALIVWSENCLGSDFAPRDPDDPTRRLARTLHDTLVVGYSQQAHPRPFNCAALILPGGQVAGVHHKIHLFLGEGRAVQPGRSATVLDTPLGRVGVEICFDSCYADVTRTEAREGARLVAMPNDDPAVPRGVLHYLHAAMLPFRAVESHVPFVRADCAGCSQIVDAQGRLLAQSPLFAPDALERV